MLLSLLYVALAVAALLLLLSSLLLPVGFIYGAPFVPTSRARVGAMLALAKPKPGELWVDLGSGDGRILVAASLAGARAVGYEFHPLLVLLSRLAIARHGLRGLASVLRANLWKADLSKADIVSLYLMPYRMERMQAKLRAELKPGCRIVSNAFPIADWPPAGFDNQVFLYNQPR